MEFKKHKLTSYQGLMPDNLVYNRHGEIHAIRPNDYHAWMQPKMDGDYGFYAIELTNDMLVKLGFVYNPDENSYDIKNPGMSWGLFSIDGDDHSFAFLHDHRECGWASANYIRYLHQLQNLYFALTGQELEYTP